MISLKVLKLKIQTVFMCGPNNNFCTQLHKMFATKFFQKILLTFLTQIQPNTKESLFLRNFFN